MKGKAFALAGAGAFLLAGAAQADFVDVTAGPDINPDLGVATIQVFANFDNPLDTLLAVGGIPGLAPVVYQSSHPLINDDDAFGGAKAADLPGFPISGEFDSWVSINQFTFADGDTDYSPDFTGVPTGEQAILGTHWEEEDGGWFDSDPGTPEQGLSMIIAQFSIEDTPTTLGTLSGLVNWVPAGGGPGFVSSEFAVTWIPAPGALALLGVAGVAGSRRRRR